VSLLLSPPPPTRCIYTGDSNDCKIVMTANHKKLSNDNSIFQSKWRRKKQHHKVLTAVESPLICVRDATATTTTVSPRTEVSTTNMKANNTITLSSTTTTSGKAIDVTLPTSFASTAMASTDNDDNYDDFH
jgi:hypothetical protein